ncbi:hypothetical protein L226DRAFT_68559 [Lentinus tigrinus ALCF2SS1-7]|uniref:Uncharacterized protein n=1 Tax=Lentinus tigrinus ALCF2SS1-6 TaxID=1328759 RepID=A0A5C2SAM3_9APHY|nr:hypothetical protein L227DRAFT_575728 [Lentinus tigrinus ALCF2SS1-6]RPD74915.1 hypothetical protein L226DRAFT_68559 [Lentinus tigrinus ALCF2SS1-7]
MGSTRYAGGCLAAALPSSDGSGGRSSTNRRVLPSQEVAWQAGDTRCRYNGPVTGLPVRKYARCTMHVDRGSSVVNVSCFARGTGSCMPCRGDTDRRSEASQPMASVPRAREVS